MEFIMAVLSIVLIDLVLSGDNAAVIGLAIKNLPEEQRAKASILGAGGAVGLRVIFTAIATLLITIPYLNVIGGVLLLWITWNLINQDEEDEHVNASNKFWAAVGSIILADLSMAFDNVMGVAGAAHGSILLVVFGLAFSVPILVWGSNWLASLMNRFPIIIYIGAAVLVHTAFSMIFHDKGLNLVHIFGQNSASLISWGFASLVLMYGYFKLKSIPANEEAAGDEE